jgi:hypothetical protein
MPERKIRPSSSRYLSSSVTVDGVATGSPPSA